MAALEQYQKAVQSALLNYANERLGLSSHPDLELQTLFDTKHDHYQLVYVGWYGTKRVYTPLFHIDIKNEKVWLQLNSTEDDITRELIKLGVPKEDIVLGFQAPIMRQFTEFAVG